MTGQQIKHWAVECGFELAGITPARPLPEFDFFRQWVDNGFAAGMGYLTDHRAGVRQDPRNLLPTARSIVSVGKLYNSPVPYSTEFDDSTRGWIARYAWGTDYHTLIRRGLEQLADRIRQDSTVEVDCRVCVDTAPLLERAYARQAGLGWIGRNSCVINEKQGSWFFLGELLTSLELEPDTPPPNRCGTCTRCIDACPTQAIVATGVEPAWTVDSRLCISYWTIEHRGAVPEDNRPGLGRHVFGCDICQDVCPWNRREHLTSEPLYHPRPGTDAPPLDRLVSLTETEFRAMFKDSPVSRSKYTGFLRNVITAIGNSREARFLPALERLLEYPDPTVQEHARWALDQLERTGSNDTTASGGSVTFTL